MSESMPALHIDSDGLLIEARETPWDSAVFGFQVAQIDRIERSGQPLQTAHYQALPDWLKRHQIRLLSCRIEHTRIAESMWLEAFGFRFIETLLHPQLSRLQDHPDYRTEPQLSVVPAQTSDLPELQHIARHAFRDQRHHLDPRLDSALADERYARWVGNTLDHPTQRLIKLMDGPRLVALFIIERDRQHIHWHLSAVAPQWQGQGYGKRAWCSMLAWHRHQGVDEVTTSISVTNQRVLNLYVRLGFRFLPAEMTFHCMPPT